MLWKHLHIPLQIRQDIEINVGDNGYVEYKVRSGVFPSVQRRQKERLVHILNETPGDFIENCEMVTILSVIP